MSREAFDWLFPFRPQGSDYPNFYKITAAKDDGWFWSFFRAHDLLIAAWM